MTPVRSRPVAPLVAVHGAKITGIIGPFIPDFHAIVAQVVGVGFAFDEPEKFMDNGFEVDFLGGDHREAG